MSIASKFYETKKYQKQGLLFSSVLCFCSSVVLCKVWFLQGMRKGFGLKAVIFLLSNQALVRGESHVTSRSSTSRCAPWTAFVL
jgi:hypothetical protein